MLRFENLIYIHLMAPSVIITIIIATTIFVSTPLPTSQNGDSCARAVMVVVEVRVVMVVTIALAISYELFITVF